VLLVSVKGERARGVDRLQFRAVGEIGQLDRSGRVQGHASPR
jgi:hypothetical protein